MDTQKITREIRMKHWMQIIAQRQQSGLTVKAFCAQQDIPIKQYYYWQHKLRIRFAQHRGKQHPTFHRWAEKLAFQ